MRKYKDPSGAHMVRQLFVNGERLNKAMKVEKASDLIYWTYFMFDWSKVEDFPSELKCTECGGQLRKAEQAVDSKGQRYDGYVCHADKRILWLKAG